MKIWWYVILTGVFKLCSSISEDLFNQCQKPINESSDFKQSSIEGGVANLFQINPPPAIETIICVNFTAVLEDNIWDVTLYCAEESRDQVRRLVAIGHQRNHTYALRTSRQLFIEACDDVEYRFGFEQNDGPNRYCTEQVISGACSFRMTFPVTFTMDFRPGYSTWSKPRKFAATLMVMGQHKKNSFLQRNGAAILPIIGIVYMILVAVIVLKLF